MIEALFPASYDGHAVRKVIDPIPEIEELVEIGLNSAQDDDLISLLSRLSVQTNTVPEHDSTHIPPRRKHRNGSQLRLLRR